MIILALDVASVTGWAVHDTDRPPSAIQSGSFRTGDDDTPLTSKLLEIRRQVPKLIKQYQPDFAAIEEPLAVVPRYKKKPKRGLIPDDHSGSVDGYKVIALLRKGMNIAAIAGLLHTTTDAVFSALEPGGMNPRTMMILSELAGGATVAVQGYNIPCVQVRAQTWQTIIPAHIRGQFSGDGAPKKRVKAYCDMLRIVSPNKDSRDACIIALWAAGHAQELKMLERARAA